MNEQASFYRTNEEWVTKQYKRFQIYETFSVERFRFIRSAVTTTDFYQAVERRVFVYSRVLEYVNLPLTKDDLLNVKISKRIARLVSQQLPLTTCHDRMLDSLSHDYLLVSLHMRPDIFLCLESIIYLHRLSMVPPYTHFQLLEGAVVLPKQREVPLVAVPLEGLYAFLPKRMYSLKGGYLQIPSTQLVLACYCRFIFLSQFQTHFKDLVIFCQEPPLLVQPFMETLPRKPQQIVTEEERELSQVLTKLPPCMYHIHQEAEAGRQMQYDARKQIVIFMKNAGIDVHVCADYLRQRVAKMRGKEKNSLEYFVYHCYGLKGNHINFGPESCHTIQGTPIKAGQFHGCILNSGQYNERDRREWLLHFLNDVHYQQLTEQLVDELLSMSPCSCCAKLLAFSCGTTEDIEDISYPNWFVQEKELLDHMNVVSQYQVPTQPMRGPKTA